jgi:dTDP-4-amino-4,6-dideoxygalactose transaminase
MSGNSTTSGIAAGGQMTVPSKRGPIFVTKAFEPPIDEYIELMRGVWQRGWFTNNGQLLQAFEKGLAEQVGLANPLFMVNGTIAINLMIRALDLKGEIITTAFSHPVTTICIIWEGCTPVFVDIDPVSFCIDPERIEAAITPRTSAILATHVYGIPCNVEAIEAIAKKHGLKVIYDGAHAFGTRYKGESILNYGDVSSTSYHATKVFHTVEGGSVQTKDPEIFKQVKLMRTMGQYGEQFFTMGLNAKNSEMHAAMGVANLPYLNDILAQRKHQWELYAQLLTGADVQLAVIPDHTEYNHSYFPMVLRTEADLLRVRGALNAADIHPRRYFNPATTELPYVNKKGLCPIAESLADRVLCLPLYHGLEDSHIDLIVSIIQANT